MNLRGLCKKLQKALCEKGEFYKVNQIQSYSPVTNRMFTKYVVIKTEKIEDKIKNTTVLETYKMPDVVKFLAEVYRGDGE